MPRARVHPFTPFFPDQKTKTFFDRGLQQKAVSLFNLMPSSTKKLYHEKEKFKAAMNNHLAKIDVLDIDGTPLERLKLENQLKNFNDQQIRVQQ